MSEEKKHISTEKARRIALGGTIAGVLLLVFLVVVLVIQFVQIGVRRHRDRELAKMVQTLDEKIKNDQLDLDFFETESGKYYLALQAGYRSR